MSEDNSIAIWHWVVRNKEWLFSGAGLTVLGIVWWLVKGLWGPEGGQQSPPTNQVTQSPSITVSPTFNITHESKTPETPMQEGAPILPAKAEERANLKAAAERITKNIYLQGDIWTLAPGVQSKERPFRALLLDVTNAPTDSWNIKSVCVKAVLVIQSKTYSPLPWIEEYTSAVRMGHADRKTIVLAVGEDRPMGSWYFVLNHRENRNSSNTPSKMDFTHLAPVTSDLPLEVQLVDVSSGELIAKFSYLWTFDTNLNFAILKLPN